MWNGYYGTYQFSISDIDATLYQEKPLNFSLGEDIWYGGVVTSNVRLQHEIKSKVSTKGCKYIFNFLYFGRYYTILYRMTDERACKI